MLILPVSEFSAFITRFNSFPCKNMCSVSLYSFLSSLWLSLAPGADKDSLLLHFPKMVATVSYVIEVKKSLKAERGVRPSLLGDAATSTDRPYDGDDFAFAKHIKRP